MDDTVIDAVELSKSFRAVVAVDRLSFAVRRGEIFGLLGPNGAGKTTTIRMLLDIVVPDGGRVAVLGRPPRAARRLVGYLPEERGLYRQLRVDDCLTYLGQLKGLSRGRARARAAELLARVELAGQARRRVDELSRGMQQKVQLIASLIHDPELVILDEPFQGLDPVNVEMVRELIRELHAAGKTVVLSAHEMSQVEALCERLLLINHGRAVLYGALAEIKRRFAPDAIELSPPLPLDGWPEVVRSETRDGAQIVYLTPGVTPRAFLQRLLDEGRPVERFALASISLDQIFIRVVRESPGREPALAGAAASERPHG
jgi:ABC-2 type transport system ATP-binding protein